MNKKRFLSFFIICILMFSTATVVLAAKYVDYTVNKISGDEQFNFEGNYAPSELTIDGLANEIQWKNSTVLAKFGKDENMAEVKVFRGEGALFFYFNVKDKYLLTQGNSNDDKVTESDSVELYLDTALDGALKPQTDDYQINLGIHGKTRIMQGTGQYWDNWNGLIDYAVSFKGTLNDGIVEEDIGYSVELMIPYVQIGINKTSAIGISFGQVDKINTGTVRGTDYDWYGFVYKGVFIEPQSPAQYVVLQADNTLIERDKIPMPNATVSGYVTDEKTKIPVEGAVVSVDGNNTLTSTTNAYGYFEIANVSSNINYKVLIKKDGFFDVSATYTRAELRSTNGGIITKQLTMLKTSDVQYTTISGTVQNLSNGIIAGAAVKVAISGTTVSAVTDANGVFSLSNVAVINDVELQISKNGYQTSFTQIGKNELKENLVTEIGEVNLSLPYNTTEIKFGGNRGINEYKMKTTRTLTGLSFVFTTGTLFESGEKLEFYIHTGASSNKAIGLLLNQDGTIVLRSGTIFNSTISTESIKYSVVQKENTETGATLQLEIPYSLLNMQAKDVFGFSGGAWGFNSEEFGDWDGFDFDGFIDPIIITSYVRCDYLNRIYKAQNNDAVTV